VFGGAEMAAIKFHGAVDALIARNRVYRCSRGLWLDWMSQDVRVTRNLFHDNGPDHDLYLEVNHGPVRRGPPWPGAPLACTAPQSARLVGGALFAHNLFAG